MKRLVLLSGLLVLSAAAPADAAIVELVKVASHPAQPGNKYMPAVPPTDVFVLRVTGDGAEDEDLRLEGLRVTGTPAPRPGADCRSDAPGSVVCEPRAPAGVFAGVGQPEVDLGEGDDRLVLVNVGAAVRGGAGDDVLETAQLAGTWDGGPGADRLVGGAGWTIDYAARTAGVSASLDGFANDGEPGEGDDVGAAAQRVVGGSGPDHLRGATAPVRLGGGPGADVLESVGTAAAYGLASRQTHAAMQGGPGDDRLLSGPGADELDGGDGDDELLGGAGDDLLLGAAGADRADGGDGADTLELDGVGDGAPDVGAGGAGDDVAFWKAVAASRSRLVANLGDDHGPDGLASEQDALAGDVEDVLSEDMAEVELIGSDGPNVLTADGQGVVDGRGGDDRLVVESTRLGLERPVGRTRVVGGAGADTIRAGNGTSVEARDGEADRIVCEQDTGPRAMLLDAGLDRSDPCRPGLSLATGGVYGSRRRPGGRVPFRVHCHDRFHACRVTLRPSIAGRRTAPLRFTVPARRATTVVVRLPRRLPRGRRVLRLPATVASVFAGVPPLRIRGLGIDLRIVRPR
ncbi:MAG TPA: calcium-binding protein [Solirubrobacteraceae bacterium]|jgi:hypothetical protein